jgi:hypothetical protein
VLLGFAGKAAVSGKGMKLTAGYINFQEIIPHIYETRTSVHHFIDGRNRLLRLFLDTPDTPACH